MSERYYVVAYNYWDDGERTGYDVKDRENPDAELGGSDDDDWAYAEAARLNAIAEKETVAK